MTGKPRLLVWSSHRQFGIITAAPLLRRIEIDVLWTAKAMHRVIHLDALPAMIIVVFVKNEIHVGPLGGEETVEALLVRQVHQLVDLAPVVPLETPVEFRIAFQGRILVHKLAI